MICNDLLLFRVDHTAPFFKPCYYPGYGLWKPCHTDSSFPAPCSKQRCLICNVCKVSAYKAGCPCCYYWQFNIRLQLHILCMDLEYCLKVSAYKAGCPCCYYWQ